MATHSSILAWKILQTEEPGGLESLGSDTTEHTNTHVHTHTHTHTHTHIDFVQSLPAICVSFLEMILKSCL